MGSFNRWGILVQFLFSSLIQTIYKPWVKTAETEQKTIVRSIFSGQSLEDIISRLWYSHKLHLPCLDWHAELPTEDKYQRWWIGLAKVERPGWKPSLGSCRIQVASIFSSMMPGSSKLLQTSCLLYRQQADLKAVLSVLTKSIYMHAPYTASQLPKLL